MDVYSVYLEKAIGLAVSYGPKGLGAVLVFIVGRWLIGRTDGYWPAYYDMHGAVKLAFDAESISIPYPQRDVHLYQEQI